MVNSSNDNGLLPAGLGDILHPKAELQAKIIEKLIDVFSKFGYSRVKPPLVEYEDTLISNGLGQVLKDSTFRIMDPLSQKMMALRSDVTAQISRIASTRLSHLPRPLRLSYSGDVLRVKGDNFNMERQKTQVGAELIGSESKFADAEIILVCLKALKSVGVESITVDLNFPSIRKYLLRNVSKSLKNEINQAIDIKDIQYLKNLKCDNLDIIIQFMESSGDHLNTIKYLKHIKLDQYLSNIRDYFLEVLDLVYINDDSSKLSIDILENRGFKYHTGLTFTVFSEHFKGEIAKGGRYKTSNEETAAGCTIYTEKLNLKSNSINDDQLVYIPYFSMNDAEFIIQKGYKVVFGSNLNTNIEKEAFDMKCRYIWKNNLIVKLES